MAEGRFAGDPARLEHAYTERLGPFTFGLIRREVGGDGGYTIHVMGPVGGEEQEVLRFDCFERQPHYHLGISYRDEPIIPIDAPRPLDWAVGQLRESFGELLEAAGADREFQPQWAAELAGLLDRIRARAA